MIAPCRFSGAAAIDYSLRLTGIYYRSMPEPLAADPTRAVLQLLSSGALGIGVTLALLVLLAFTLPRASRRLLTAPAALLGGHILLLLARLPLDPASMTARVLAVIGLFLLLTALGRAAFLLIIDVGLGARLKRPLPRIFRDIIQALVFIGVALITLRSAGVEPGSLLTTSALLTAVVGLSLQETLGNLFAGLSIQAQRPFEVGDWIQIEPDPRLIGRVIEINWRATTVLTLDHVELIIPNGTLAKTAIRNFTKPSPVSRRIIEVQVSYTTSPRQVQQVLLSCVHGVAGIRPEPPPFVLTSKFADSGINYVLQFFIDDFSLRDRIESAVRQRIWFAFQRAHISIPYPTHTIHMYDTSADSLARGDAAEHARRVQALRGVDFLAALPAVSIERLATLAKPCHYMLGEVIIRQGEASQEFFIIEAGEVSVLFGRGDASVAEVARLGPGKFFGEMSLMTGERRAATIQATADCELIKVDKDSFHEILAAAPHLAERITQVLVERQAALEENLSARTARTRAETEAKSHALLSRIRLFFSL
jgi:small-conductance mechanosensitive channel